MPDVKLELCAICGERYLESKETHEGTIFICSCRRCGIYQIYIQNYDVENPPWLKCRHLLSAWVRRRTKGGGPPPLIGLGLSPEEYNSPESWCDRLAYSGFPETTGDKLDALLLAYSENIHGMYRSQIHALEPYIVAEIAAKDSQEIIGLTFLLVELEYIKVVSDNLGCEILAKGWLRIDDLRKTTININSSFIAMWFGEETKKYRDAVTAAISYCGYQPIIVDQKQYNDFIMNQVIASIRQARFLVADFTSAPESVESDGSVKNGVRGGVYWEAGMAFGLGRQVIHTCKKDKEAEARLHFDVKQYNTLFWTDDELGTDIRPLNENRANPTFAERLAAQILATIGRGSYLSK